MNHIKTKTVTVTELANILAQVSHATPIGFTSLTDARAKKTDNPYGTIRKLTKVTAFTGATYETSVNRQMVREGNGEAPAFVAKERSWGNRISAALVSKLDNDTGEVRFYLPAQIQRASKPLYLVLKERTRGKAILTAVPKEIVAPWLPKEKPEAPHQPVDKPIVYRDYSLDSLITVSIGGCRYRVRRDKPLVSDAPSKPKVNTIPLASFSGDAYLEALEMRREAEEALNKPPYEY